MLISKNVRINETAANKYPHLMGQDGKVRGLFIIEDKCRAIVRFGRDEYNVLITDLTEIKNKRN
jgi:hypothetical protein